MDIKRKKQKRPVWLIALLALVTLTLFIALLCVLFIYSKLALIDYNSGSLTAEQQAAVVAEVEKEINTESWLEDNIDITELEIVDEDPVIPAGEIEKSDDILNILLLGTDERADVYIPARADSIMILSLNLTDYTAKLVSVERGMGVPILEGEYKGQWDWITHAFRYGGAELMLKELQTCLAVDVTHYVRINFAAFVKVIDILGGVDIELTEKEANYLNSFVDTYIIGAGSFSTRVQAGENHLNGQQALMYARTRHIDSDWVRITRQRNIIQQIVYALKGSDLTTVNKLADEVLPLVQTNFTPGEIMDLLVKVPGFLGVKFDQMTIPVEGTYGGRTGMGERGMFAADFETNAEILHDFLYGEEG